MGRTLLAPFLLRFLVWFRIEQPILSLGTMGFLYAPQSCADRLFLHPIPTLQTEHLRLLNPILCPTESDVLLRKRGELPA